MRYSSKDQLLSDIRAEYARLLETIERFSIDQREAPGVWGDDWTLKDLIAHLAEWQVMFLRWHEDGRAGREPEMPAPGYKWNETPRLNRDIQVRHEDRSWEDARGALARTHDRIVELVEGLSEAELLEPGHFAWTGANSLTTYLGANTASHYRFATKVVKRWSRQGRSS